MTRILLFLTALTITAGTAHAQQREQQVFSPYPQPSIVYSQEPVAAGRAPSPSQNRYMVYPGRENYGDRYGYIPRHPGDYRDAVDRGQWEGGGGASMPRRSFGGY